MIPLDRLLAFLGAAVVVTLAPGPDILYVLTRGVSQGPRVALAAAAGFALGNFFHTLLAAVGLSALIIASPAAFRAVKLAGATYLIYLGVQMGRHARSDIAVEGSPPVEAGRAFKQSIVANVLNPKVAVFFLAFLPGFVDAQRGAVAWQFATLGTVFAAQALIVFSAVALAAGSLGNRLRGSDGAVAATLNRLAAVVLVALGAVLALS